MVCVKSHDIFANAMKLRLDVCYIHFIPDLCILTAASFTWCGIPKEHFELTSLAHFRKTYPTFFSNTSSNCYVPIVDAGDFGEW